MRKRSQSKSNLEPQYLSAGEEFEDSPAVKMPKWRIPQTMLQTKLLAMFGCKYWPRWAKELRYEFIVIEKSASPITVALVPDWPIEWVQFCMKWTQDKRKRGHLVNLTGFMSLLKDQEAKDEYTKGVKRKSKQATFSEEPDEPYK